MVSRPAETLMKLSVMPKATLSFSAMEAWVIRYGSSAKSSNPPRDSARGHQLESLQELARVLQAPLDVETSTFLSGQLLF